MDEVRRVLAELIDRGAERGLQVAVYRHGEPVASIAAGLADPVTGHPVTESTVFHNFSIVKAATSALAHVLVERGAFGYDTPLVRLWPEFGAHGKSGVTVRHVLTHSAGLPALPPETSPDELCDWDRMCALIAGARPRWAAGTRVGYHAYTFGFLIGELVRRATGEPLSRVLRAELTEPLGIADELYFGMPVREHRRLARLEGGVPSGNDAVPPRLAPTAEFGNRADVLAADIPAGGKTSARATARLYAALLGGTLVPLDRLTKVAAEGVDAVFGNPSSWSLGFALGITGPGSFGMAGAGGSFGYADPSTGIAFALTKKRLTGGFTAFEKISRALARDLGG
jgi:CubicO group peptidase (beta-lactamase class C family)